MRKILLGFVFSDKRGKDLLDWGSKGLQTASNQYQLGFLEGIGGGDEIISATALGGFPFRNKKLLYKTEKEESSFGKITYLPFFNFYLIREKMFELGIYKQLRSYLFVDEQEIQVYVYSLFLPFLRALKKLKEEFGERINYCLIIPDLPSQYGLMRSKYSLRGLKDRLEIRNKFKFAHCADSFVFLTESMADLFPPKPYTVIEGFLPQISFDYKQKRDPKTILYTGSLNAAFGIKNLLKAFMEIEDPQYRLWICGVGDHQKAVEDATKIDQRIQYMGYLDKKQISLLQTRCDVLINPRPPQDTFTKYSFPSKTMEYLLSGSKVLMYKLEGIPQEYYKYIYEIKDSSVGGLKGAIIDACNDKEFFVKRSSEQIQWMLANKNAQQQVAKIINCRG